MSVVMLLSVVVYLATRYGLELCYVPNLSPAAKQMVLRLLTFVTATAVRGFNLFYYSTQSREAILLTATPVIDVYSRRRTVYVYGYVMPIDVVIAKRDVVLAALLRTYMSYYKLARLDKAQLRGLLERVVTEFSNMLTSCGTVAEPLSTSLVREIVEIIHVGSRVRVLVTTCSYAMTVAGQVLRALQDTSLREFSLVITHRAIPTPPDVKFAIQYPSDRVVIEVREKAQTRLPTQQLQLTRPDDVKKMLAKIAEVKDPREAISQIVDLCIRVPESVCRDVRKDLERHFLNAIRRLFELYKQARDVTLRQKAVLDMLNLGEKLLLSRTSICLSEKSLKMFAKVLSRLFLEEARRRLYA